MAKETESLSKFDKPQIDKIGDALYSAVFHGDCEFSLKRHEHPDYDPYGEDTSVPQYFWTLTARPKGGNLEVTMIVRGMSWTQTKELWFSKDNVDYSCRSEVVTLSPSLKKLKGDFLTKAAEIHDAQLAKEEGIERKREDEERTKKKKEAEHLISSLKDKQT